MTEEQLIESGRGYCNEQARVFIALCTWRSHGNSPARLCFLLATRNGKVGHTATRRSFSTANGSFHDVTLSEVRVRYARSIVCRRRELQEKVIVISSAADSAYRDPLTRWFATKANHEHLDSHRAGDLFASIAICNYLIDGIVPIREVH